MTDDNGRTHSGQGVKKLLFVWRDALKRSELPGVTRAIALWWSTYADTHSGDAYPGASRVAHDSGFSERRVRAAFKELVAKQWLSVLEYGGLKGERRRANHYQARFPDMHPCTTFTRTRRAPVNVTTRTPERDDSDPCTTFSPTPIDLLIELSDEGEDRVNEAESYAKREDEPDPLKRRCIEHFSARKAIAADDCRRAVDQLRAANIGDTVIDEALGQCENADARALGYLVKVARDFYKQRTGDESTPNWMRGLPPDAEAVA